MAELYVDPRAVMPWKSNVTSPQLIHQYQTSPHDLPPVPVCGLRNAEIRHFSQLVPGIKLDPVQPAYVLINGHGRRAASLLTGNDLKIVKIGRIDDLLRFNLSDFHQFQFEMWSRFLTVRGNCIAQAYDFARDYHLSSGVIRYNAQHHKAFGDVNIPLY